MSGGALILAAGKSTRIRPLSGGGPKPLLHFGGKRLIEWNLEWLAGHGLRSVWINLHYRPEEIRAALGAGERYGLELRYAYEAELLGTAGAWRSLRGEWGQTSLVVYGDNVSRFDLEGLLATHRRSGAAATVALFDPARHPNTGIAGGQAVLDESGRITEFREGRAPRAGKRGFVNAGAYLLERDLLDAVPPGFQDFGRDILPSLLPSGRIYGHRLEDDGFCLGLDTPDCFAAAERLLEAGRLALR